MRTRILAIAISAFVCIGCRDKDKSGQPAQPRSEAEAEAIRASQAQGKARTDRPQVKLEPGARVDLVAPQLLAPTDGTEFSQFPRRTMLKWAPVTGAVSYKVAVEYQSSDGEWLAAVPATDVKATEYEFDFVGAQPGRWHVSAVDASGHEGPTSAWWTFRYTK